MNDRQKTVQKEFLNNEELIIKNLKSVYNQSLKDINKNIEDLMSRSDSDQQYVIYQVEYQKTLKKQISSILDTMENEQFKTVSEYLTKCYDEGFLGTMYDLHGQGIPLVIPIDQEQVIKAVQLDSKISNGLYSKFGENVSNLKKDITSEVSRGISTGMSYSQVAQQIRFKMIGTYNTPGGALAKAMRIARTEGHRIQTQAGMDACYKAKEKGADVVKQWDATLDSSTRESHQKVDGEIKELDEKFSNGLMFPGDPHGKAAEVINCRCALLQRARWALGNDFTKMDNKSGNFLKIKANEYDDFKKKYFAKLKNKEIENIDITENGKYKRLSFNNIKDYKKYITPEYNLQSLSKSDISILWAKDGGYIQNADGYKDINGYMRGLKSNLDNPKCQKTMEVLIEKTSKPTLQKNYIGIRKVQPSYLKDVLGLDTNNKLNATGMSWESFKNKESAQQLCDEINKLVGTEKAFVTDKAVTSISLCEKLNFFKHRPVKFEIQMPKGAKGLITTNYPESEFIAKPNSTLEILGSKVYYEHGKSSIIIFSRLVQD